MYVSIALFHYISNYIYVYICLSAVLSLSVCLPIKETILLSSRTHCAEWDIYLGSICWSWAFTKLNVVYCTERSDCVKRQEDHCYSDVCMYFFIAICLSIHLLSFCLLTVCLCVSLSKNLCYCPLGNIMQTEQTYLKKSDDCWLSSNKMWCNIGKEVWPYEEARRSVI
jgi:hypothetical protein